MSIKVIKVIRSCTACPSQWEGESSTGQFVYARYRAGRMRVDVAPTEDMWVQSPHRDFTVYTEDFGHPLDGYITYDELKTHTTGVLEWPESDGDDGSVEYANWAADNTKDE